LAGADASGSFTPIRTLEAGAAVRLHLAFEEIHRRRTDISRRRTDCPVCHKVRARADLFHDAVMHHHDLVGHGHGFDLIVGDIDRGGLQPLMQFLDFGAHRNPQLGVKVGQRLVEQKHLRSRTMARPIATRWRCPPDNWRG